MKTRIIAAAVCFAVTLSAAAYGISEKKTYTDITSEPEFMYNFQVAEVPEDIAVNTGEGMIKNLPDSALIVRVTALGDYECLFKINRQAVRVDEVYKGRGLSAGDNIYIATSSWALYFDNMTANTGFVNTLEEGKEYLVFLDEKIEPLAENKNGMAIYRVAGYTIAPVFSYDEHDNVIAPVSGDTTYVNYADVANNEFFVTSEAALSAVLEVKEAMLKQFPRH